MTDFASVFPNEFYILVLFYMQTFPLLKKHDQEYYKQAYYSPTFILEWNYSVVLKDTII